MIAEAFPRFYEKHLQKNIERKLENVQTFLTAKQNLKSARKTVKALLSLSPVM